MDFSINDLANLPGMAESVVKQPPTKIRRVCEHCESVAKTLPIRYTESTRYCSITKSTKRVVKDQEEAVSSSDISSIDELDLVQEQECRKQCN